MTAREICHRSARVLAREIAERRLSVTEVVSAFIGQIERWNPDVNAICTFLPDEALDAARRADRELAQGATPGPLFGLPIAVKDFADTKGIRTTYGSPIFRDHVPAQDAVFVERLRAAGAIVLGKTNVPEFAAGSHTFNPVFGATKNPYDLTRSAGGSSGGGAAALAARMLPIADGSDMGGSVRNPPSFNNVVGLRPSPGRIPHLPTQQGWETLPVIGPMGRDVEDAAFLLSVLAGPDPRDPLTIDEDPALFRSDLRSEVQGTRVAFSADLGAFPVAPDVRAVFEGALRGLEDVGCEIEEAHPSFEGAPDIFQVLRARAFAFSLSGAYSQHRDQLKDTVIWNIEKGLGLTVPEVSQAQAERTALFARMSAFLEHYDFLVLPTSQVAPFPVEWDWVREIDGVPMQTYIDWMQSCSLITLTSHPALSLPAGFTDEGLPVGLQIVGRYREELSVLRFARALEDTLTARERLPGLLAES